MKDTDHEKKCRGKYRKTSLLLLVILLPLFAFCPRLGADQTKKVLVLHSYHRGLSSSDKVTRGIEAVLKNNDLDIELFFEYMDTKRIQSAHYLQHLYELYGHKFKNLKFDVIVSSDDYAFKFLLAHHGELFPDTPIVFCGVNDFNDSMLAGEKFITGVVETFDAKSTIEVALKLQPETKEVFVISDKTLSGIAVKKLVMMAIPFFEDSVSFSFLEDLDMLEIQEKVGKLPKDSFIFFVIFTKDRSGNVFSHQRACELISLSSAVPLYSSNDVYIGRGIVGGMLTSGYAQGEKAGEMALRILKGEKVNAIPVVKQSPNRYMFDYQQMERFGIEPASLPEDSIIINEPPSFYSIHKRFFWSVIAGISGLIIIILFLSANIISRRRIEAALRKSEDRYRALFDNNPVDTITVDREGKITGYSLTKKRAEDRPPAIGSDVMYRDYAAKHKTDMFGELIECIRSGESKEFPEKEYNDKFLDIKIAPFPEGAIITSINVTDRKRAEEELRDSEARYRRIFENTGTAMMIIDEDKTIVLSNTELAQLFGYSREEIEGKRKWTEFVAEEDLGRMEEYHRSRRIDPASAPRNYEFRFVDRYGDIKDIFITVDVLPGTGRSVASLIDITDRKRVEGALRESERKYRFLTETVVDMIFTLDSEGRFTYLNPEFERLTGYAVEDFIGQSFTKILVPEYIESTVEIFKRGLSGEPTPVYEVEIKNKDGRSVPVEVNVTTMMSADVTPTGRIGIARDITDRKRAEVKLRGSLREKEVLLQEIHHRVKNNMQIISSLLSLQSQYVKDKEALEMFKESRDRIFSMSAVHDKLYQSGNLAKIDFDGYIKNLSRYLLRTYSVKRSSVRLNVNCSGVYLGIDKAVPCGLIINELISNALKHAFPEGSEGEITVDFYPDGNGGVKLVVSDNGIGFPKDADIDDSRTLGLHLVTALIDQLKGTLEIEKEGGTTFRITFTP